MTGIRIPAASCPDCRQILLISLGPPDIAELAEKTANHQCPEATP